MMRRLISYAHREIQYYVEVHENETYTTPSQATLDTIGAVVDDLEDTLMADCTALVEAVECICTQLTMLRQQQTAQGLLAGAQQTVDDGWFSWDRPGTVGTSEQEEEACALAQAHWNAMWEGWTEIFRPALTVGFDDFLPAAAAAIAAFTGGLGIVAILGVYVTAEAIEEVLEIGFTASAENYQNWMFSNKEEIICASFEVLFAGGDEDAVNAAVNAIIDASEELSPGDKAFSHLLNYVSYRVAKVAQDNDSAWFNEVVEPGYCIICNPANFAHWSFPADNGLFDAEPVACNGFGSYMDMPYHYITDDVAQLPVGGAGQTCQVRVRGYINKVLWDFPPTSEQCIIRVVLKEADDLIEFLGAQFPAEGDFDITEEVGLSALVERVDISTYGTNAVCVGWWVSDLSVHAFPL
jgi:hypothetical protein